MTSKEIPWGESMFPGSSSRKLSDDKTLDDYDVDFQSDKTLGDYDVDFQSDKSIDDYVVDYPPTNSGSRRIHKIQSSSCKCNLGAPYGVSYVFVQGKDSACLVTHDDIQGTTNPVYDLQRILMSLGDPCLSAHPQFKKKKEELEHFAVVSVLLAPEAVSMVLPPHELNKGFKFDTESWSYDNQAALDLLKESSGSFEKRAIYFLKEKLENDTPFTLEKTIQTAISGLQHLYDKNFQADEIKVSVVGEMGQFNSLLSTEEIVQHLTVINNS